MCLEVSVDRVVFFWILFVDVCELLVRILEFMFWIGFNGCDLVIGDNYSPKKHVHY